MGKTYDFSTPSNREKRSPIYKRWADPPPDPVTNPVDCSRTLSKCLDLTPKSCLLREIMTGKNRTRLLKRLYSCTNRDPCEFPGCDKRLGPRTQAIHNMRLHGNCIITYRGQGLFALQNNIVLTEMQIKHLMWRGKHRPQSSTAPGRTARVHLTGTTACSGTGRSFMILQAI